MQGILSPTTASIADYLVVGHGLPCASCPTACILICRKSRLRIGTKGAQPAATRSLACPIQTAASLGRGRRVPNACQAQMALPVAARVWPGDVGEAAIFHRVQG